MSQLVIARGGEHDSPQSQLLNGFDCLSMESMRQGGPAHGIVTKTIHKTLPGGGGGPGGGWVAVVGVQEWVGRCGGVQGVGG